MPVKSPAIKSKKNPVLPGAERDVSRIQYQKFLSDINTIFEAVVLYSLAISFCGCAGTEYKCTYSNNG